MPKLPFWPEIAGGVWASAEGDALRTAALSPQKCRPQPQPTHVTRRLSAAETELSRRIRITED